MMRGEEQTERAVGGRVTVGQLARGASVLLPGDAWGFDTVRSSVRFSVRHMMAGRVRGQFTKARGTLSFDPSRPEASRLAFHIDADSIDTGNAQRDAALRAPEHLHAERYPLLTFRSAGVRSRGDGRLAIEGTMEIRGVQRDVVLDASYGRAVRDLWGNDHLGVEATVRIDRGAFGLRRAGELFLAESVELELGIEASRLPVNAAA